MFDDLILHDLKNPLSGITGSLGLFLEGLLGPVSEEQKQYLENIDFSAKKLALLLRELTAINNAENGMLAAAKSSFPAGELRAELNWVKQLAAKENKTIAANFDDNLSLTADKELIITVSADLLLNAAKQIDRDGRVVFNIKQDKDGFLFEIIYQGEGLPPELAAKVFDKNFRAANPQLKSKTSPGLGFYFCKLAVAAQGGRIGLDSGPGKSSRLYFSLPK